MVHRKSREAHDVIRPVADRVPLAVAITISGKDRSGRPFAENTMTIEISGRGARIATAHDLLLGGEISVENALGQTAAAKVLWRNETGAGREFNEFGIVLLESAAAESLWRELPSSGQPENTPPPGTADKPDPLPQGKEACSAIQSLPDQPSTDSPSPALDKENLPAEQGRPGQSGLTSLAELGNDNHLNAVVQASDAEATLPSTEACRNRLETQAAFRAVDVKVALESIDSSAAEAVSRLRTAQEAMESSLTAKIEETKRRLSDLASSAIAAVEEKSGTLGESLRERALNVLEMLERSSGELLKQTASAVQAAGGELATLTAGLIDKASGQIERAAQAASESLAEESKRISESQVDATANLAATRQQAEAALEAKVAEVFAALESIDSSAADAVSRLRAAQEAVGASLTAKIEESERRLSDLASSAIGTIEEKSGTVGESLRERLAMLERSSGELLEQKASVVRTAGEELVTLTTDLIDDAQRRISHAAQTASKKLAQESKLVSKSQTQAIEVFQEQVEAASRSVADATATLTSTRQQAEAALEAKVEEVSVALESIDSSAAETVSRLRTAQQAMESSLTASIEETERRVNGLKSSAIAVAEEDSKTFAESLRERAQSIGLEMLARSSSELLKQTASAVQMAGDELRTLTDRLIDEASSRITRAAQAASEKLAQEGKRISESSTAVGLKEQAATTPGIPPDAMASLAATRLTEAAREAQAAEVSVALESIESSATEALSRLRTAQEAIGSSLTAKIEETERRLSDLVSSAIAGIEEKSGTLGESLRERALNVGLEMLERSSGELLKQTASAVQTAGDQLSTLTVGLIDKASGQVERAAQAASQSLAQESKLISESQAHSSRELTAQGANAVRAAGEDLRSLQAQIVDETANHLRRAAEGVLASLARDSKQMLEEHKNRASQMLGEQARALAGNADAAVSRFDSTQERLTAELRSRIAENEKSLGAQLNAAIEALNRSQEALLNGSHDQMARELSLLSQEATRTAQDEMRANVAGALHDYAQQLRQQTEEARHAATIEFAASRAEFKDQVTKELSDLTRAALASLTDEIRTLTTEQVDEFRRRADLIGDQSSHALEKTQGKWLAKQKAIIRKDLGRHQREDFRSLLSRLSSTLTTGARIVVQRLRLSIAVAGIIAAIALTAFSVRPVRRLKTTPPDAFFDEYYRVAERGTLRAAEQKLALAYWECALQQVQRKYPSNADLPESPPPEFEVDVNELALGRLKEDADTRLGYWQRLRAVWASPDTWNKSYEWNTDWAHRPPSSEKANPSR